jgi:hypothetical protein
MPRLSQGRGYPDISFLATDFQIVVGGDFVSVFGTSGSAPGTRNLYCILSVILVYDFRLYPLTASVCDVSMGRNIRISVSP